MRKIYILLYTMIYLSFVYIYKCIFRRRNNKINLIIIILIFISLLLTIDYNNFIAYINVAILIFHYIYCHSTTATLLAIYSCMYIYL